MLMVKEKLSMICQNLHNGVQILLKHLRSCPKQITEASEQESLLSQKNK